MSLENEGRFPVSDHARRATTGLAGTVTELVGEEAALVGSCPRGDIMKVKRYSRSLGSTSTLLWTSKTTS